MFLPLQRRTFSKLSHTIDLSKEYYAYKYKDVFASYYKTEQPQRIRGYATQEGTEAYSQTRSSKDVNPQNFKVHYSNQLKISTLGIGTYQGKPDQEDDIKLFGSLIDCLQSGGVNHIDTAINYRYMKSERVVGAALRYLVDNKLITRDQVFIATKNGYIPADGDRGILEQDLINKMIELKIVQGDDVVADCHCMHPNFLEYQLMTSLDNLGLETVDCMYLHNAAETQMPLIGAEKFYKRLADAFEFYEKKIQEGKIKHYGLATWVSFRAKPDEENLHLSLEKCLDIAKKVAGDTNNLKYIQLPINLMMSEAFLQNWQPSSLPDGSTQFTSILNVAKKNQINVISSQPLLNGALMQVPLSTRDFLCENLGAKHLQFVRSIPAEALKTTLVGMKKNEHTKMNLEVITRRPLSEEEFKNALGVGPRKQDAEEQLDID